MLQRQSYRGFFWFALRFAILLWSFSAAAQERLQVGVATPLKLEAKQTAHLLTPLREGECGRLELSLKGGIVSLAGEGEPRWPIDLGRGAELAYVVRGGAKGDAVVDVSSMEHERAAEVSVVLAATGECTSALVELQEAEDDLARAEAARRHWKDAPAAADAAVLYQQADGIAAKLNNTALQRLAETQYARYLLFQQTRFAEAEALLQRASALPASHDAAEEALTYKTLSSVEADLAHYDAAIAAADKALALYRGNGDVYWQGIVLGNVSAVYAAVGRYADAARAAKEALADAKLEKDAAGVVYCLAQLANTYRLQGDFEAAFRAFREGIAWVNSIEYSPLVEAEIRDQMGEYYANMGQWSEAREELTRCLQLEGVRDDPTALEARGTLGAVLEQERKLVEADAAYSAAIETAERLKLLREETLLLLHRAHERKLSSRVDEALADLATATQAAAGFTSPALELQLALASGDVWQSRDGSRAQAFYSKANGLAEQLGDREDQAAALAGMAAVENAQRHHDVEADVAALASIDEALRVLETTRSSLNSRELAVSYFSLHRSWYGLAIDIAMELEKKQPGSDYGHRAFVYAERARARALLDTVAAGGWHVEDDAPEPLQQAMARNRQAIEDKQAALDAADASTVPTVSAELLKLYQEQDAFEAQAKGVVPGDRRRLLDAQVADVDEVQRRLLTRNSALVAFWVGEGASYRWLVTKEKVEVLRLPGKKALDAQVLPLLHRLQMRQARPLAGEDASHYALRAIRFEEELGRQLADAGSLLLAGLPRSVEQVYMVGDGALFGLPWNALRIRQHDGLHYAIEKYLFVNEPSASVTLQLKGEPAATRGRRIAVVSDAEALAKGRSAGVKEVALTSVVAEARKIRNAGGASVTMLAGRQGMVNLDTDRFSILHFAAHTVTMDGKAELTGIRFGSSRGDDTLWLHDIYALRRTAPLVVLSGCATEGGMQLTGEGMNSLAQAFFFAGAHGVVGSLWKVDDAATSRLIGSLYHGLLVEDEDAAHALRQAQLEMLHAGAKPMDWAAFVMNGLPSRQGRENGAE